MEKELHSNKFELKLEANDVIKFNFHSLAQPSKILTLLATMAICIIFITKLLPDIPSAKYLAPLFLLIIFFPGIILGAKRHYKANKFLQGTSYYCINEEEIHIKGVEFDSKFSISALKKITENKSAFYIWHNNSSANIVPKRFLNEANKAILKKIKTQLKSKK